MISSYSDGLPSANGRWYRWQRQPCTGQVRTRHDQPSVEEKPEEKNGLSARADTGAQGGLAEPHSAANVGLT